MINLEQGAGRKTKDVQDDEISRPLLWSDASCEFGLLICIPNS